MARLARKDVQDLESVQGRRKSFRSSLGNIRRPSFRRIAGDDQAQERVSRDRVQRCKCRSLERASDRVLERLRMLADIDDADGADDRK